MASAARADEVRSPEVGMKSHGIDGSRLITSSRKDDTAERTLRIGLAKDECVADT
jgi:hypothetical protein